jgi:hypothetical protein
MRLKNLFQTSVPEFSHSRYRAVVLTSLADAAVMRSVEPPATETVGKLKKLKNRGMKNHSGRTKNALQINCGPRFFKEIFPTEFSHSLYRAAVLTSLADAAVMRSVEPPATETV